jgi:hypothetical protein
MGLYYNCWLSEDVLLDLIEKHAVSDNIPNKYQLRKAYTTATLQCVNLISCTNSYGIFRREYKCKKEPPKKYFFSLFPLLVFCPLDPSGTKIPLPV